MTGGELIFGLRTDYVLAYKRPRNKSDDGGQGKNSADQRPPRFWRIIFAMLTNRLLRVNVREKKPSDADAEEDEKVDQPTPAASRGRFIKRLEEFADIQEEVVPDPDDESVDIVFLLITLYDKVLIEAAGNMSLLLPKFPPVVC